MVTYARVVWELQATWGLYLSDAIMTGGKLTVLAPNQPFPPNLLPKLLNLMERGWCGTLRIYENHLFLLGAPLQTI